MYVFFFLCFGKQFSFFLPLLEAKTWSLSGLIFLWVRMLLSALLAFLSPLASVSDVYSLVPTVLLVENMCPGREIIRFTSF